MLRIRTARFVVFVLRDTLTVIEIFWLLFVLW